MKSLHAMILPSQPSVIVERRVLDLADVPNHKKAWWRPVEVVGNDSFDPLTHKRTGPVTTIEPTRVVDTYTVVERTAQEISDRKEAAIASVNGDHFPQRRLALAFHNRIRALEGQPAHSMVQFLAYWKALL